MGDTPVDPGVLREQPAARPGYPADVVGALPDAAVESFAGVGDPAQMRALQPGERADKAAAPAEARRVLRPGRWLQFPDIADGRPVPVEAMRDIDLWTG
jgi:hypothetical protein